MPYLTWFWQNNHLTFKNIRNIEPIKRWPKITEWQNVVKVLNLKEKLFFFFLVFIFVAGIFAWGILFYLNHTQAVADFGGEYTEGIVGQPSHINPLLAPTNETDADLTQIIYSGLFKYDGQGNLIPDLAEQYDISEDKTVYTVRLKDNVTWHDGQKFSAEDVIFTANLISDPAYKSSLRYNWQGVKAELIDNLTVEFKTETPYAGFLNNLTFGILPKHIWENVSSGNFILSSLNLEPIGTGPYKYSSIQKDSKGNIVSYKLSANPAYFEGKPYISKVTFIFYIDETSAIDALNQKEIMGINVLSSQRVKEIKSQKSINIHQFKIPRYFAVFLNQTKSIPIASDEVRKALAYATDREEIIKAVLDGNGQPVYSPIMPGMIGYSESGGIRDFDLAKANEILDAGQWTRGEDGIRTKNGNALEIDLVTTDWDELADTAQLLKSQWEKIGARVNINSYSISDIQQNYIRPREYQAFLFGQVLGADPDPFYFWHSSQKNDPGLNLSKFGTDGTDRLIDDARKEFDPQKRAEIYAKFQEELYSENPAIFLYSPAHIYPVSRKVKGINAENLVSSSKRFSDINHWYIKTNRVKK